MTLENQILKLKFSQKGAELKSVYHKILKKELLYDGKSDFWNRSAPILFPIVGKLKENKYKIDEKVFCMTQHGFARDFNFELSSQTEDSIQFQLADSTQSFEIYPFHFKLIVTYLLIKNKVEVIYEVKNTDNQNIYFSLGAHPGFAIPFFENEKFDDYYLEFESEENVKRYLLNPQNGLFNGETEKLNLTKNCLFLNYSKFLNDAIVLKNIQSKWIKLKSLKSNYSLRFNFTNFPYFGIWTKPNAPFICLEPWCGLADSENSNFNFLEKEGLINLKPNEIFARSFSFEINF
jgi:galactose mutarotase-like enzyme